MTIENVGNSDSVDDEHLDTLLTEYQTVIARVDKFDDRTIQFIGIGITVLGIATGYLIENFPKLLVGIAFVAPVPYLVFLAVIVYGLYQSQSCAGICRALTIRINQKLVEPSVISYEPDLPPGLFFSTKRGNPKFQLILYLIIFGGVVLLATILALSFIRIHTDSPRDAFLFLLVYTLPVVILAYCFSGVLVDVPDLYRDFAKYIYENKMIPTGVQFAASGHKYGQLLSSKLDSRGRLSSIESLVYNLIPRPLDILMKMHGFWWGFGAAFVLHGLDNNQLSLINNLFAVSKSNFWVKPSDVPFVSILSLGVLYFVVQEFILQQAKLLWDDIRDHKRDRKHEFNKFRGITRGKVSLKVAKWHVFIRLTIAFVLGWLLGGTPLLALYIVISIHQVVYVLFGKDRDIASKYPLIPLFVLAPNVALRFVGGLMVLTGGVAWLQLPFAMMFAAFYLLTIGTSSAQWKIEAQNLKQQQNQIGLRPQSWWFLQHGNYWQRVGFLSMVLVTSIICAFMWFPQSCRVYIWGNDYDFCNYRSFITIWRFLLIVLILVITSITSTLLLMSILMLLQRTFARLRHLLLRKGRQNTAMQHDNPQKLVIWLKKLASLLFPLSIAAPIYAGYTDQHIFFWGGFLLMSMCLLFDHENKTYADMTFQELRKNAPIFSQRIETFLFTDKLTFKDLFIRSNTKLNQLTADESIE